MSATTVAGALDEREREGERGERERDRAMAPALLHPAGSVAARVSLPRRASRPPRPRSAPACSPAPTVLAFDSGGYFPRATACGGHRRLGARRGGRRWRSARRCRPPERARWALAALAAFAGWVLLSQTLGAARRPGRRRRRAARSSTWRRWSRARSPGARSPAARAVEPALAAGDRGRHRLRAGRAPAARDRAPAPLRRAGGRLEQPLTYWNAMGALAAIGVVLCARLAGDATRSARLRAAAAAAVPALGHRRLPHVLARRARGAGRRPARARRRSRPTRAQLRALVIGVRGRRPRRRAVQPVRRGRVALGRAVDARGPGGGDARDPGRGERAGGGRRSAGACRDEPRDALPPAPCLSPGAAASWSRS